MDSGETVGEATDATTGEELLFLKQCTQEHSAPIRALCFNGQLLFTGDFKGVVILWERVSTLFEKIAEKNLGNGTIFSVVADSSYFICGTKASRVFVIDRNCNVMAEITGHQGPVSCLWLYTSQKIGKKVLLSGSWDGTARLWDLEAKKQCYEMSGHTYAVTVSHYFKESEREEIIVTGSYDGTLKIWSDVVNGYAEPASIFERYHSDMIRGFHVLERELNESSSSSLGKCDLLLSYSNDGFIKALSLQSLTCVLQHSVHSSLIYDMAVCPMMRRVITCSEDCSVKVFGIEEQHSILTLKLPSVPCQVEEISSTEIACGLESGELVVWTARKEEMAFKELAEDFQWRVQSREVSQFSPEQLSRIPPVSQRLNVKGKKTGEYKLFKEREDVYVFQWNGSEWEKFGEALRNKEDSTRSGSQQYYEGDGFFPAGLYDYVLQVDIGFNDLRPLPFRKTDDPMAAAKKLCARENISDDDSVEQIVSFLENSVLTGSSNVPKQSGTALAKPDGALKKGHPLPVISSYIIYPKVPTPRKLEQLILNFNQTELEDFPLLRLDELEISYLKDFVQKLTSPHFEILQIRKCEIESIYCGKLGDWPENDKTGPVMELWSSGLRNFSCTEIFKKVDQGWRYISKALKCVKSPENSKIRVSGCKFLCNMFGQASLESACMFYYAEILEHLEQVRVQKFPQKTAWIALVANLCLAVSRHEANLGSASCRYTRRDVIRAGKILSNSLTRMAEESLTQKELSSLLQAASTLVTKFPGVSELVMELKKALTDSLPSLRNKRLLAENFTEQNYEDLLAFLMSCT